VLLGCTAEPSLRAAGGEDVAVADTSAPESVPGAAEPGDPPDLDVFADTGILQFELELANDQIDALQANPKEWVQGTFRWRDEEYTPVGIHLKGNSTYQWLDGKPAWKLKFDEYVEGGRFHGKERLTLNSNYWDGSQMAETLAYRTWRKADSPAPRTGYAQVTFNGEAYGLYTIVEAMDDQFVERWWPGSDGGLYEMNRSCDFDQDCACYELQDQGANFDASGLHRACAAAVTGDLDAIQATWDWERFLSFQAVERVVNHPDTYSYNLNNYYVYHDPLTDTVALTPWGADSTFTYVYPPNDVTHACEAVYLDDLATTPGAYMAQWCMRDPTCWPAAKARMLDVADQLEDDDLLDLVDETHDRIAGAVASEPRWPWGYETFEYQVACFRDWIGRRPDVIRQWVGAN
jgi:hypothetical protein